MAAQVREFLEGFLAERGLELSRGKTLVTHIDAGFDFLGWNFRKYDGTMLVTPSRKSVGSFVREMHRCILRESGDLGQDELIRILTPKIRGFANYHRHTCASGTFSKIDHIIHFQLMRWSCRRHPRKRKGWVYDRYWFRKGGSKFVFGREGLYLPHMAWQHIVRHVALKSEMNPYLDQAYFAARKKLLKERNAHSFHLPTAESRKAFGRA